MKREGNVGIKEAAERMGLSEQGLRLALQQGRFDFGTAIKGQRWVYYINRERFDNYLLGK